jgi:AcrR family transcriptional regulator
VGNASTKRRPGRPAGGEARLTRQRILATALTLVDENGLQALTMRRLATELDVDPMSIYHHLPNKAAIVSGLVDTVFAEMRLADVGDERWEDQVRAWAQAYRDLAGAHPNLVLQIVTDAAAVSEAAILISEPLYVALDSAGLPPTTVVHASGMLVDFIHGFALGAVGFGSGTPGRDEMAERLATQAPDRLPAMRRGHAAATAERPASFDSGFDAGIEIMICGLRTFGAPSSDRSPAGAEQPSGPPHMRPASITNKNSNRPERMARW